MLKLLRKKGVAKRVIWVVAIIVIISFGFLGTAYLLTDTGGRIDYAGKIFGKKIEIDEYNTMFNHVRIQAILKYGDKYRDVQSLLDFDQETWDRLILNYEVRKRRINVSNEELIESIEQIPLFQRNGQFDSLLYNDIIRFVFRNFGISIEAREFEESMRDTLKFGKLFEEETKDITIDSNDVFAKYKELNEKVQIDYVIFKAEDYLNDVKISEDKLEEYFNDNKLEFTLPPSIKVKYIELAFPEEPNKPDEELTEDEVLAIEDKKDELRQQAQNIYEDLIVNPKIDDVAKEYDVAVIDSGILSMDKPNLALQWPFNVYRDLFDLSLNDVTGPYETVSKLLVMQVVEKNDAIVPTLEQVREKVRTALENEESKFIAHEKAKENLQLILQEYNKSDDKDFTKITKAFGLEAVQTPLFKRGQYLPKLGISPDFESAAFSLNENNKISSVVKTELGTAILHLAVYQGIEQKEFEENSQEIADQLLYEKKAQVFAEYLTHLRTQAKLENNIAKLREQQQAQ